MAVKGKRIGEPSGPRKLPAFFRQLFRKPTRREDDLAARLEEYACDVFGPERSIPVLCQLAAQRLLSLDPSLFSPELLADEHAMDTLLAVACAVAMESEETHPLAPAASPTSQGEE